MTFADKATEYFLHLTKQKKLLPDVELINPYEKKEVQSLVKKFYQKYFNDNNDRIFVFGINPGRFGGGLTGISFTDPIALRENCGIENSLGNRKELSSKFICSVAEKYGGTNKFFSNVFLTALYPFAIIKDGKNYNYYDEKSLADLLKPAITKNIKAQIDFGARRDAAVVLGKKNADYFLTINQKCGFFKKVAVLEHPRYIMQYRIKRVDKYIDKYVSAISGKTKYEQLSYN
jgi:hypothetical protein